MGFFLKLEIWVPPFEHGDQFSVESLDAGLQQEMRPTFAPLHLLLLTEPFAYHLVDR